MLLRLMIVFILLLNSSLANSIKKGEKIYSIMCDKEKVSTLSSANLKERIIENKLCGNLSSKNLDALLTYLSSTQKISDKKVLHVPQNSRCPVCGMFVAKYPKWVAIISLENGEKYYFDGVKDMMKFYFDPKRFHHDKKTIKKIAVTDYYTLKALDAKKAFFVQGSSIYGPMGEEFIPFAAKNEAETFLQEHHGKAIYRFDTIKEQLLY